MTKTDVFLVTEDRYLNPENPGSYENNILSDDRVLMDEFAKQGFSAKRVSWTNSELDWSAARIILIRTTWDYFEKRQEFIKWLNTVDKVSMLINPLELLKWNFDKIYLKELKNKGINIPPTHFVSSKSPDSLGAILSENNWNKAVLKPNISGAAYNTFVITNENCDVMEPGFQTLKREMDMMIQEFQTNIPKNGEVSHVIIGGQYTHSILKKAKAGDFRVQDDFGGTVHSYTANSQEISFVEKVVSTLPIQPEYARVDVFKDNNNKLALGELEVIEPELWFRHCPEAGKLLVQNLINKYLK